jgi:membrane fusion protein, heavy metal efflux system
LGNWARRVQKDQPLYTIKSPDLIQAESNLIGAAATFELTNKELAARAGSWWNCRAREGTGDLRSANRRGALKAARDAVRVFGKTNAEIDQMIASRKIDPALVVHSPIAGKITYNAPARDFWCSPEIRRRLTRSPTSIKWMLANVSESEIPLFHLGQPVQVKVMAYPGPRVSRQGFKDLRDG